MAPWVQATGRLRCLVQGCCHGRLSPDHLGIRYHHPLSRVCKLAQWPGRSVYPTQLYSIIGNVVILGLLLRLWFSGADLGFIAGAVSHPERRRAFHGGRLPGRAADGAFRRAGDLPMARGHVCGAGQRWR